MKTRLVRIGNSRGVRIPKPLIEQAGLTDEVEMGVRDGAIVIAAIGHAPLPDGPMLPSECASTMMICC